MSLNWTKSIVWEYRYRIPFQMKQMYGFLAEKESLFFGMQMDISDESDLWDVQIQPRIRLVLDSNMYLYNLDFGGIV